MIDMKNEQWLREKYEEVCGKNPEEYALISLKIKRFRIFNRLFGREAGDRLVEKVYKAISEWTKEDEYVARISVDGFNLLVKLSKDYDEIFHYIIDFNAMCGICRIMRGTARYIWGWEYICCLKNLPIISRPNIMPISAGLSVRRLPTGIPIWKSME